MSSRLPFVSMNYALGSSTSYHVFESTGAPFRQQASTTPILSGQARVRAVPRDPLSYPSAPVFGASMAASPYDRTTDIDVSGRATPGWTPESPWVPLGDDFLSVLDACEEGAPIFVDVHRLTCGPL